MRGLFFGMLVSLAIPVAMPAWGGEVLRHKERAVTIDSMQQGSVRDQLSQLRLRQERVRASATDLAALAREPKPSALAPKDEQAWLRYQRFLNSASERVMRTAELLDRKIDSFEQRHSVGRETADTMNQMLEMNRSFSMQYLQLQQKIQAENRQFSLMSNIMKTKHDAAKTAINNIR